LAEEVELAVERLLEDETLTAPLDDAAARLLLAWGIDRLREGCEESQVRRSIRTLAQVAAARGQLSASDAAERLCGAGLTVDPAWAAAWEETPLPSPEWLRGLLERISLTQSSEYAPAPKAPPSRRRWWQRLLRRRCQW
jgi:hypothetical protein